MCKDKEVCKICGKKKKLTYEHIPPRKAFNEARVDSIRGDAITETIAGNRLPWDRSGLRKSISQNGTKMKTICADCNSLTGSMYASEYVDFVRGIHVALKNANPEINETVTMRFEKSKLCNIFKQIIAMFASTSNIAISNKSISRFILNKNEKGFPSEKYRVLLNVFGSGMPKITGPMVVGYNIGTMAVSQIVAYPFEISLIMNYDKLEFKDLSSFGTDVTDWSNYDYDQEIMTSIRIKVVEVNSTIPFERRSKSQIRDIWSSPEK